MTLTKVQSNPHNALSLSSSRKTLAAPLVVVRVHAALTRSYQSSVGEKDFEVRVPAGANRVSEIVAAYNKAVADVLSQIVKWTGASAR